MIITNPDAFRTWLTSILGSLCDADPAALAKYVIALVKKDKPENELKEFCLDQLEVFLSKNTRAFVDLMFETLKQGTYPQDVAQEMIAKIISSYPVVSLIEPDSAENSTTVSTPTFNGTVKSPSVSTPASVTYSENVESSVTSAGRNDKSDRKQRETSGNAELESSESKKYSRRSRSPSKSRSKSPFSKNVIRARSPSREADDLRRGRYSDDGHRRPFLPKKFENRRKTFRNRRVITKIVPDRDRDRNDREHEREIRTGRDCERFSLSERGRSRSLSRSRSGSWDRIRSRSRSWSSNSESSSWSRSRERSKDRSNRSDSRNSRHKVDTPQHLSNHGDTDYRVGVTQPNSMQCSSASRNVTVTNNHYSGRLTKRCQDYDEKGYCMRGDLCLFDHGTDPLVVEDVSVLNFGVPSAQVGQNTGCVIPPVMLPRPESEAQLPPPPPSSPPPPPPPPPPLPPNTYAPEPYNPEAPGMNRPSRDQLPYWPPPGQPNHQSPGLGHPTGSSVILGGVPFNPSEPPPSFHNSPKQPRTRELIGVPTLNDPVSYSSASVNEKIEVQENIPASSHQMISLQKGQTTTISVTNTIPSIGPVPVEILPKRKSFDYNRLGPRKSLRRTSERCTLELRKVPHNLNTITLLNNHFSKFGTIVNLQVSYDGDPEAAIVQFSNHTEATSAYRSTEAVLNNRFIKVFWHNKEGVHGHSVDSNDALTLNLCPSSHSTEKKSPVNRTVDAHNDLLPEKGSSNCLTENNAASSVIVSSKGNLSRTVYNPAALKKNNVLESSTFTVKKYKEEQKKNTQEKIKLVKRKREVFLRFVKTQKLLLERLAKSKNEKEREFLNKSIAEIQVKITNMQADVKKESEELAKMAKTLKNNKVLTNKMETEKELLDAEMDLYNKQHKGDDISDIIRRVNDLKQQAKAFSLFDHLTSRLRLNSYQKRSSRFRGRGRSMGSFIGRSIDHRPRKLLITDAISIDKEVLKSHFSQFGDVESIDSTEAGVTVAFKSRKEAETAMAAGYKYGDQSLNVTWCQELTSSADQSAKHESNEANSLEFDKEQAQSAVLEEEDEDDDEDSEARSWRR